MFQDIVICRYNPETCEEEIMNVRGKYNEPMPQEMREFKFKGKDMVSLLVYHHPVFRNNVLMIAPATWLFFNAILLFDQARAN